MAFPDISTCGVSVVPVSESESEFTISSDILLATSPPHPGMLNAMINNAAILNAVLVVCFNIGSFASL